MPLDFLAGIVWLGVNLLLARGVWLLGRDLFPHDTFWARAQHAVVLFWAVVIAMATLLGALALLTGPILLTAGVALAVLLVWSRSRSVLVGLCSSAPSSAPLDQLPPPSAYLDTVWRVVWSAILALWGGRILIGGLLGFPSDCDSLMYHLPLIDHFLQARHLYTQDCGFWYNPSNNELFGLWIVAPFSGDFLYALMNLPAGVLFVVGTIELGQQIGLGGSMSHLTALAGLANYAVGCQLLDAGNDIPAASFALAALCYGLRRVRSGRPSDLLLASICLGLGAGTKYYALGPVFVVAAAVVLAAAFLRGMRAASRVLLICLGGVILGGGFWYVRNAFLTGLPLYPLGLTPSNNPLRDIYPQPWRSSLLGCGRAEVLPLLDKTLWNYTGPCQSLAFWSLPASLLGMVMMGGWHCYRGKTVAGTYRLLLGFVLVGSGLALAVTPFAAETLPGSLNMFRGGYAPIRFGLCFYTLMLLSLALLVRDLAGAILAVVRRRSRVLALVGVFGLHASLVGIVLYQAVAVFARPLPGDLGASLLVGINLLLLGWLARLGWMSWPQWRRRMIAILGISCWMAAAWAIEARSRQWHAQFITHYDRLMHTHVFTQLAARNPGRTRLCALTYCYYPILGSRRQFRVCQPHPGYYVVDADDVAQTRRPFCGCLSKGAPDLPALQEYIRLHQLNAVVARNEDLSTNSPYQDCVEWLWEHPQRFIPLFTDPSFSLFEVDPLASGGRRPAVGERTDG